MTATLRFGPILLLLDLRLLYRPAPPAPLDPALAARYIEGHIPPDAEALLAATRARAHRLTIL